MARFPQIAAAVIVAGAFAPFATAQAPPAPRDPAPAAPRVAPAEPRQPAQARPAATRLVAADLPPERRPPVRLSVLGRRSGRKADRPPRTSRPIPGRRATAIRGGRPLPRVLSARQRVPGRDATRSAWPDFGAGRRPGPGRANCAAQQVGIQRYNSIQRHIDSYAHPYGFGFGFGAFGGFNRWHPVRRARDLDDDAEGPGRAMQVPARRSSQRLSRRRRLNLPRCPRRSWRTGRRCSAGRWAGPARTTLNSMVNEPWPAVMLLRSVA